MACKCKNEDGTPTSKCTGMCVTTLEDRIEYMLNMFDQKLKDNITATKSQTEKMVNEYFTYAYKSGFSEGFRLACDMYKRYED